MTRGEDTGGEDTGNEGSGDGADTLRFAAFISYSHADAEYAAKLQRQLERYKLPKNVRLTNVETGSRLGRIFRDRDDLAAAPSLSDAIRAALDDSGALVVICSPDAKKSRWVSEEIALFRESYPDRPVLAALVRGAPEDSFPDALTANGLEPLAADLRKQGDGWQLGFLKIVAGIAAVPLDALVQRDAQRRLRRVMWITLAAIVGMLVMGVMTAYAISARNEAARQRASAEGLVEYMLTDLRTKLKGVGRLDVMDDVNQRAMEHYARQGDLSTLPADALERRARVLHAMGEDDDRSGNLAAALAKFREAHRATEALLRQEPENPDRIFAHAQSEYWVGQAAWRTRDRATTERHWQGYVSEAGKLLDIDPDKARANLEMGYALGNLCDLYLHDNFDVSKAIDHCKRSIAFERRALQYAPERTEISIALANRYGWLADALLANKDFAEARRARLAEKVIIDGLVTRDPKNFELRFRQSWPILGLATIALDEGKPRLAAAESLRVIAAMRPLVAEEPRNTEVKRGLARGHYSRAKAAVEFDTAIARTELAETRRLIREMESGEVDDEAFAGFWKAIAELEEKLAQKRPLAGTVQQQGQ